MPLAFAARARETRAPEVSRGRRTASGSFHFNLYRYCRASLPSRSRAEARHRPGGDSRGAWAAYSQERDHYSAGDVRAKRDHVREWIQRSKPAWILDLGANTGEFSLIGAQSGARVIAVDSDHDSIERLYLQARGDAALERRVHPVVAELDDLCAGRGWRASEVPGLLTRLDGRCDLVLMLGLVHHLTIAAAIPVAEVAALAAAIAQHMLILEIIPEQDPMFRKLAVQYGRGDDAAATRGQAAQLAAFARYFDTVEQRSLPDSHRTLLLLAKKSM
jgi:hypothetical protein